MIDLRDIGTEFCTLPTNGLMHSDTGPPQSIHYRITDHVLCRTETGDQLMEQLLPIQILILPYNYWSNYWEE